MLDIGWNGRARLPNNPALARRGKSEITQDVVGPVAAPSQGERWVHGVLGGLVRLGNLVSMTRNRFETKALSVRLALAEGLAPVPW